VLDLSFVDHDPSETCGARDFCGAHWALSPVSLLAIFCFDDGSWKSLVFENGDGNATA
jgi:hypothetical protein